MQTWRNVFDTIIQSSRNRNFCSIRLYTSNTEQTRNERVKYAFLLSDVEKCIQYKKVQTIRFIKLDLIYIQNVADLARHQS